MKHPDLTLLVAHTMALTLIGYQKSLCTLKVLLTLADKGITDYKFVNVDLENGEQKAGTPPFLHQLPSAQS
jgi:hypothetical protein